MVAVSFRLLSSLTLETVDLRQVFILFTFSTFCRGVMSWATVPLQVISKLSYNRPSCVRNGVVPDNSVMSYTFPAAVSFTNIVSPTVQIPCG